MSLYQSSLVAGARLIALGLLWGPAIAQTAARNASPSRATHVPARPTTTVLDVDESGLYVQLPDGRLMGFTDRVKDGVPEAIARYSTNEGRSWSEPQTLVEFPKGTSGWTMNNVLLDRHGEIHLIYYKGGNNSGKSLYDQRLDIWHVRSVDGRTRFKPPKLVWEGYAGALLSVVQLRSGRILLPFSYLTPRRWRNRGTGFDAFTYMGRFSSSALYSDDDGDTWHQSPDELKEATATIDADGGIEPIVIQLKNGVVWMLIRTQDNYFFESFSKDDGAHWSRPRPTRIMSSDSPPSLTRLKDGRILMLWNNCLRYPYANGGRHVMHGAVSEDEGRAWRGFREVARSPMVAEPPPPDGDHGVSSYGVPGLTKEGNIVAALPWPGGPGGKSYLLHVDPSWLYEIRQADDFSKGLEQWSIFGTKGVEVVVSPDKPGDHALQLRKPETSWPAAAVWNFPAGAKGRLRLRLLLKRGFAGARLSLTDHFSVPFDELDENYNLCNFNIGPDGRLANGKELDPGRWHNLQFDWDCGKGECGITENGRPLAVLRLTRETIAGVSYLRLVSTADDTDKEGLLLGSISADVSESWPK